MKVLIITEKLATEAAKCSTYIAKEAVSRGHEVYECYSDKIGLLNGEVICEASRYMSENMPNDEVKKLIIRQHFDVVFFRPNPPIDMAYLTTLYLLQIIENDVLILNKPSSVIRYPEKILPHYFPEFSAPTLISKNRTEILEFMKIHNVVVTKPLYSYAGKGVEKLEAKDTARLDAIIADSKEPRVYQKFLHEVYEGDFRLIFVNGKFIAAVKRIPKNGGFIANLDSGMDEVAYEITDHHRNHIVPKLEKFLVENDIALCGIDVIGNYVSEINITSPVTFLYLHYIYERNEETKLWDAIEDRLSK